MKRKIIRILLFILGGILGLLLLYKLYLNYRPELNLLLHFDHHNEEVLVNMVRSHGIEDLAFLFLLNAICVAILAYPTESFVFSTESFMALPGDLLLIGSVTFLGQIILMELLQKLYDMKKMSNSKVYKLLTGLKSPMLGLIIGYMIPFIPSATVSYVNIMINKGQRKKQLIPIIIGVIPFAYLYAYGGDSILHLDGPRLIKVVISFVVIALIAVAILLSLRAIKKRTKKA